ncbi:nuclear cap-binding protein subunit 2-like [Glossophaga mutica]
MSKDLKIQYSNSYLELSEDRYQHFSGDNKEREKILKESCTLYVGNLSISTTKEQIFELFSRCGNVRNVFMGLGKIKKMACCFCFVEYHSRTDAENAMPFLNGTILDDYMIHRDWDLGFREGRQYGCDQSGDQVKDEFYEDFDAGRGGFGKEAEVHDKRGTP